VEKAYRLTIEGQVQGIGFRPYIYRLAQKYFIKGYVLNSKKGVIVEIQGKEKNVDKFLAHLHKNPPALSYIISFKIKQIPCKNFSNFEIKKSQDIEKGFIFPPADISICPDCLKEIFDKTSRRYLYPFTNCTQCGPRFSIVQKLPYDRQNTTMSKFKMCPVCEKEYNLVLDRRYHAQPNCCPVCGPQVQMYTLPEGAICQGKEALCSAIKLLEKGEIVAIKGIGGFHICCDATNKKAVSLLRRWKRGSNKPFAVMVKDIKTAENIVYLTNPDKKILSGIENPILIVPKKNNRFLSKEIAPENNYLGIMLAYTGLHHILLSKRVKIIIATSGNIKEEPIITDNIESIKKLNTLTKYFLIHNRDIYQREDDTVISKTLYGYLMIRRSRGYVPFPFQTSGAMNKILAAGSDLKNTFALSDKKGIFLSQYIGDLENKETFEFYKNTIRHFIQFLEIKPEVIACDLHPQYFSTQYAQTFSKEEKVSLVKIQHHHAHLVSCMADNNLKNEPVIGVCFDGTGYTADGTIWGGEFLIGNYDYFERKGSFLQFVIPGGETAIKQVWKTGISLLYNTFGENIPDVPFIHNINSKDINTTIRIIEKNINSPVSSSAGRIFDGISAILGIKKDISFEGEAAIFLQMRSEKASEKLKYEMELTENKGLLVLDYRAMIKKIIKDIKNKKQIEDIGLGFHLALAKGIKNVVEQIRNQTGIKKVCFSGGVFQNNLLVKCIIKEFRISTFTLYFHKNFPANDGGISLGQIIIANNIKDIY
jgi:hydrogenase maturation protein HypF